MMFELMDDPEEAVDTGVDSPANRKLVDKWRQKFTEAKTHWQKDFRRIRGLRKAADGDVLTNADGDDTPAKRVSWCAATVEGLHPVVYARMPEVQVQQRDSLTPGEYPFLRDFARTLEILLNSLLEHANLTDIADDAVRLCFVDGVVWAKCSWQQSMGDDPLIVERIADAQDNIRNLELMLAELQDPAAGTDYELRKAELDQLVAALEAQKEIIVSQGIAVDLVMADQLVIDPAVRYWHEWKRARWMAHHLPMPLETAKALFPQADFGYLTSTPDEIQPVTARRTAVAQEWAGETMVQVVELWDKSTMTVYTFDETGGALLREPYQPENVTELWYPFRPLAFKKAAGRFFPPSVVEKVKPLDDEYNSTRDKFETHRNRAIPKTVFRKDALSPEDAKRLNGAAVLEAIPLDGPVDGQHPVENVVGVMRYPPVDGALYDTNPIRFDMEVVSGLQDAQRGGMVKAKTAAEAEIMQSAASNRVSAMQDALEKWIGEIAGDTAEMALLAMDRKAVADIVGGGAVWPELTREETYRLVRVKIRAGTSGKPDKLSEQRNWAEVMPLVMQLMDRVLQHEQAGLQAQADAHREMLGEMLRRLDERIEVDRLLPKMQPQAGGLLQSQAQGLPPTANEGMQEAQGLLPPMAAIENTV